MVRLVGQEVTGACKAKAQSGALLRVGGAIVPFCLEEVESVRDFVLSYISVGIRGNSVMKKHVAKIRKSLLLCCS